MSNKTNHSKQDTLLNKTYKMQQTAAALGFKWPNSIAIFNKLNEEAIELATAIEKKDLVNIKEEIGDLFFTVINFCCLLNIDPNTALEHASKKFERRFTHVKKIARKNNINMALSSLAELQALWQRAKQSEK